MQSVCLFSHAFAFSLLHVYMCTHTRLNPYKAQGGKALHRIEGIIVEECLSIMSEAMDSILTT
jgi:hypothetical protein